MPSVFEIDNLPTIIPLRYHNEFSSGANKPILVTGVDKISGKMEECVVKLMGAERMRPESASFELLASFIAWQWEILVVDPLLIEITEDFVESMIGQTNYSVAKQSIGLNYGSRYLRNYQNLPVLQPLNNFQLKQAQKIFCFDVFITNVDRTFKKANSLINQSDIVICDHELAFGFIYDIFPNRQPWIISDEESERLKKEMIYISKIKRKKLPEDEILPIFDSITNEFWDKAFSLIPSDWRTDHLIQIRETLNTIIEHKEEFLYSLQRIVQ